MSYYAEAIKDLQNRVRKLEDDVARYRRREEQTEMMLQRIAAIPEEHEVI